MTDPVHDEKATGEASVTVPPQSRQNNLSITRLLGFFRFSWISFLATILVFTIPFALLVYPVDFINLSSKVTGTIVYWLIITVLYFLARLFDGVASHLWQKRVIERDISNLYEQLETGDFFTTLIRINFKYIDKYYLQTQLQANKSYYLSAAAAVVSLLMIVVGIVMLFFPGLLNSNVTPAYITMAAGVLGEFIATVFFYLYNRTVLEMSNYHQKLVLTQNISLALRIADNLGDVTAKAKAQVLLIECLCKDINMHLTMQSNYRRREKKYSHE